MTTKLSEITTFYKGRAAAEQAAGYPQSKEVAYGLELLAALEAVTAERDVLVKAAKPFASCKWVIFDQEISSTEVTPSTLAKLREAVRKAEGGK